MILHTVTVIGKPNNDGLRRERTEQFGRRRVITTTGAERILKREGRLQEGETVVRVDTILDQR